ncbi:Protein-S-isoprenylcysteine O-methyltransferase Ste14 [Roseivivax lentus]|uniref:Protein-S-isoprenylcysteine O-methyltransferase Ste14 n=1 Tax=Roseivivax lentus TaxID=633194 RepID=A0A1N7NML6_9RHOB|nr:isoprenylcysteine carboxylmethyltransferase family protein [Roseivivax lentus]SIS99510.1 Protein-S-isoprenylcysteine O-methyltransferase Ste14 [Roseivivax lentus]
MKWIDMPPVWLLGALVLARLGAGLGAVPRLPMSGAVFIAMGLGLIALAAWEFRRARTTIIPRDAPSALIRTGIFAKTRNPIYLGDALILAGCALWWGSLPGLLLVPVFIWLINKRFIAGEEARLRDTFLAEFDAYAQQVRRWL